MNDPSVQESPSTTGAGGARRSGGGKDIFRFKAQLLVCIFAGILAILGVFTHWFNSYYRSSETAQTGAVVHRLKTEWENVLEKESRTLRDAMDILFRRLDWRTIAGDMDRDLLLATLRPYLADILEISGIDQFQLVLAHGSCFLRVHDPLRHGDLLDLSTVRKATQTGEEVCGVDIGPFGNFTLNYLRPVVVSGEADRALVGKAVRSGLLFVGVVVVFLISALYFIDRGPKTGTQPASLQFAAPG